MSSDEDDHLEPLNERTQSSKSGCSGARSKNTASKLFKINSGKKCQVKPSLRKNSVWMPKLSSFDDSDKPWNSPDASSYLNGSKKRQNGDKTETIAKSKRTCLGNRLFPDWSNGRRKNKLYDHPNHLNDGTNGISDVGPSTSNPVTRFMEQDISPEDLYEKHSEANAVSCEVISTSGIASTSNNRKNVSHYPKNISRHKECSLDQPSTSKGQASTSNSHSHQFSDSDSDDFLNCLHSNLRKTMNKDSRKLLNSDDSSDNFQQKHYRLPHDHNLLSESDDSSDFPRKVRKKYLPKVLSDASSSDSNENPPASTTIKNGSTNSKKIVLQHGNKFSRFRTLLGEHSYATSEQNGSCNSRNEASAVPSSSNGPSSSTTSIPMPIRSRYPRRDCTSHRTGSPHYRNVRCRRHSGTSRPNLSQVCRFHHDAQRDLVSQFPDLFEADDSSEVEFFTANSYSDTETSAESLCANEMNPLMCHPFHNRSTANRSPVTVDGSSEDEISVVFSGSSCFPDSRSRHRGQGGRQRRSRGTVRSPLSNPEEISSASPDPVEQVRQMEEDEQYARMLQAEYDAEVNHVPEDVSTEDNNEAFIVDPLFGNVVSNVFSDAQSRNSNVVSATVAPSNSSNGPSITVRRRARFGTSPSNVVMLSGGRRRRGRRNFSVQHGDPWMWQFARILGLGPTQQSHEPEDVDYEALLRLVESVGEVIPRGLHKTEINRLPTRRYFAPGMAPTAQEGHDDVVHKRTELNKECQVCLCDYENGDVLRILPCFHEFHTPCIDPWLKINHTCPVCRVEVRFDD